jgi:hypothetical protein
MDPGGSPPIKRKTLHEKLFRRQLLIALASHRCKANQFGQRNNETTRQLADPADQPPVISMSWISHHLQLFNLRMDKV